MPPDFESVPYIFWMQHLLKISTISSNSFFFYGHIQLPDSPLLGCQLVYCLRRFHHWRPPSGESESWVVFSGEVWRARRQVDGKQWHQKGEREVQGRILAWGPEVSRHLFIAVIFHFVYVSSLSSTCFSSKMSWNLNDRLFRISEHPWFTLKLALLSKATQMTIVVAHAW